MPYDKFSVGVLFENSDECVMFLYHGPGAARVCVVLGFCFVWFAHLALCCGVGLGLVWFSWTICTDCGFWLTIVCGWLELVLLVLFGSLILAQDEPLAACLHMQVEDGHTPALLVVG